MIIRNVEDYYDKIQEKFPDITKNELDKILKFGMRSFYLHNLYGGDVLLKSRYFTMYSGKVFSSNLVFYHYWRIKHKIKLRIKYKRNRERYQGCYYFGLTDNEFEHYKSQIVQNGQVAKEVIFSSKPRRKKFHFNSIYGYKIMEECFLDKSKKHFFKLNYPVDMGFVLYFKDYVTRNISYIYTRNEDGGIQPVIKSKRDQKEYHRLRKEKLNLNN